MERPEINGNLAINTKRNRQEAVIFEAEMTAAQVDGAAAVAELLKIPPLKRPDTSKTYSNEILE